MEDKLQSLYNNLIKDNYDLPSYDVFKVDMQNSVKSKKLHDTLLSDNYELPDYDTFSNDLGLKKKDISLDTMLSAAKGETILQDFGQPSKEPITPKLPYQGKKIPKTTQEETLADELNVSSVLKAQQKLPEYLQGEQERVIQEATQDIQDELSKLADTYKKKIETTPEKSKALQKEFEQKQKDIIDLRSANIPMAIEGLYKKGKDYKWLDPTDVKEISKLAREIASKPTDFIKKKDELESLRNDFMSKVGTLLPEEQDAISKELSDVIAQSSILDEKGSPTVFGWKQEVLTKQSNIEQSRDKMLVDNPELANIATDYNVRSSKEGKQFMALARANEMFNKVLALPDDSGSFIEGFKSQGASMLTAGMSDLFEAANITKILRKQNSGEELTSSEQAMVDAYGIYQAAQGAGDFSKAYTRGQGIVASVAYMESFALTGGLGGVGEKTALKLLGNQVKNKVVQNIVRGIGSAAVRTPILPGGAVETAKRLGGTPKLNKEGEWKVDPATVEPTIKAIGKGLYSNFVNALGETAGGWLAGTKVSSVISKGLGINKIPKGVAKIFNTIGMQPLGELPEEYLTTLMETPVMGDQTLKEAFSGENVWETAVQVGLMSGFFGGIALPSVVGENLQRARNKEIIDLFGKDKVAEIRTAFENDDEAAFKTAIDGLGDITDEQKRTLVKYANSLAQEKGAKVAQEAAKIANEEAVEEAPVETTDKGTATTEVGALEVPQEKPQPKTQSLYNKGQVIDMLLAEYPEDVRNEMRDEFAKEDNDKFTEMAAQAGFNSLGAGQYTFESVAKTSEQAPQEVKEPTGGKEIETLEQRISERIYKDPDKPSRWRIRGSDFTYNSKKEASSVVENEYNRDVFAAQSQKETTVVTEESKPLVKKIKDFKTDEGSFSVYDIEEEHKGRGDMFTVLKDKNGYIIRNALIPENLRRKGIATDFYKQINEESIKKTGNPLRSTQERKLITGEKVHELTPDAISLWDSFVKKGLATKIGEKNYKFLKPAQSKEQTKLKEETQDAKRIREEITKPSEQAQGMVEGEKSSLRVRNAEENRVETQKGEEVKLPKGGKFEQFTNIVNESKTSEEAFKKAQEIKNVPAELSEAFRKQYDPENKLTPQQAFDVFYNEVKESAKAQEKATERPSKPITTKKGTTPPKKEITPTEAPIGGKNEREKALLNRMHETKDLSKEFKDQIAEKGLTYKGIPNSVTAEETDYLIADKGIDDVEKEVLSEKSDLKPRVRVLAAARLIKALDTLASKSDNEQDEIGYRQRAVRIADFIDETGREWGQGIQEFGSVEVNAIISPKTQAMRVRKTVRGQRDARIEDNEPDISKKAKSMREVNKEQIEEALASKVYNKAKQGVTLKPKSSTVRDVSVPKEKIKKEQEYRKKQWDVFKKASGTASVSAVGLNKEQVEAIGNIIASYVREGFYRTEVLAKKLATDWKKNTGKDISLEEAEKMLPKEVEGKSLDELQAIGEEIEASALLSNRVMRMLKDPSVPKDDPIKQMVETLFGKITEKDTKEKGKPEKKSNLEKIKEALLDRKGYADVWEEAKGEVQQRIENSETLSEAQKAEYTERLQAFYDEVIGKPFSEKQVSGAIKDKLKELEISIDKIIRDHYTVYDATKRTLQEKLIEELGITGEEARMIADAVSKEFDKIAIAKKRAILKKGVTPKEVVRSKTAKQVHDKLIELTNLGAFTDTEFSEAYADKWGFPKLEPEQAQEIERLVKLVQDAPEGYNKFERVQDLLAYVENIKGIDMGEVGMSMWYSSILSGYRTQAKNFIQNTITSLFEGAISTIQHPLSAFRLMQALGRGWGEGVRQFGHIMATGYNPIKNYKVETPNIMERFSFKGGNLNPANWAKYVTRIMVAADAFSYAGLKEMRSYEVAMNMARAERKNATEPSKSNWARATELLNRTSEKIAIAEEQARQEGLSGIEYRRRVWELMEQGRPKEMVEDAAHFAALGTFNYQPEGVLGMLTQAITFVTQGIAIPVRVPFTEKVLTVRPGKFIIPFTRIIANVTNMALDYYPIVGLSRAAIGGVGHKGFELTPTTKKFYRKYTAEERQKVLIKAMVGLTAQIGFFLLSEPDDDGESAVEITANGYGDYQKNYELKETGWQPYSIKIGNKWWTYQYTPLMLALAPIGYFRDMQKYNKEKFEEDTFIALMGLAHFKGIQVINDMTWASSLNALQDAMKAKEPGQAQAYFTNLVASTSKSFVYPKIAEQITQVIDAAIENPRKDTKTLFGRMRRDIPIVRNKYNDMLNAVGQPVIYDPLQMISTEKDDPFWTYLAEKNITIGKPNAKEIFYDDITKTERAMTDDEYYNFVKTSGQEIRRRIEEDVMAKNLSNKEAKQEVTNIKSQVRKQVKTEMFGWGEFRATDEEAWGILNDYGAIPVPQTSIQDVTISEKETYEFTEEDITTINNNAIKSYSKEMIKYINSKDGQRTSTSPRPIIMTNEGRVFEFDYIQNQIWAGAKRQAKEERLNKVATKK